MYCHFQLRQNVGGLNFAGFTIASFVTDGHSLFSEFDKAGYKWLLFFCDQSLTLP